MLDGRDKLEMWWVEEGYLTDLSNVLLVRQLGRLHGSHALLRDAHYEDK